MPNTGAVDDVRSQNRERIIDAARDLLRHKGQSAVTTRAVADRAGVQAPTIYRLFGDKDGLLDAVAEREMTAFASSKRAQVAAAVDVDPVEDLLRGWLMTVDFGLANPELYALLSDPARAQRSLASHAGVELLADRVRRVALAGRLKVSEPRAVDLIRAAGTGAILATLAKPVEQRDHALADSMFGGVLDQILESLPVVPEQAPDDGPDDGLIAHAIALRARSAELAALSPGERTVLGEWLDRIIESAP
jgi:AcrR family transcriptional regulator